MKGRTKKLYLKALKELRGPGARETGARSSRVEKEKMLREAERILRESTAFVLIDIENTENRGLKEIRRKISETGGEVRVFKNKILLLAMKRVGMKNIESLEKYLNKPTALVYSSKLNVFELASRLEEVYYYRKLKPGEKAPFDIVIPAGPTDIPPGPMMSVFGRLKIPVQPREGRIYVMRDTVAAKQGQEISVELASLLNKLGIAPVRVRPKIIVGYEDGIIFEPHRLKLDLGEFREKILEAQRLSTHLASELALPVAGVLEISLVKAYRRALAIALETGVVTGETIGPMLARAVASAYRLAQLLGIYRPAETAPTSTQEQEVSRETVSEKKEEEEKGPSEESIGEALSALFG